MCYEAAYPNEVRILSDRETRRFADSRWSRWTPAVEARLRRPFCYGTATSISATHTSMRGVLHPESTRKARDVLHEAPHAAAWAAPRNAKLTYDFESSAKLLSIFVHDPNPSDLLMSLPRDSIYTSESILFLTTKCPLNHQSTILAVELCRGSLPHLPIDDAATIFISLMRRLGHNNALAAVQPMVSLFLLRIEQAVQQAEVDAGRLQAFYGKFIAAFHRFGDKADASGAGKLDPLPSYVRLEIARAVQHLFLMLDTLPSTSNAGGAQLESKFLRKIMLDRFMSAELANLLVDYAERSNTPLKAEQLQRCFVAAVSVGDHSKAKEFLAMKRDLVRADGLEPTHDSASGGREMMTLARSSADFDELYSVLQTHLTDAPSAQHSVGKGQMTDEADLMAHRHSWSILIARAAKQSGVKAQDILDLYAHLPSTAVCGHTLTPVMKSLQDLGDVGSAWKVWLEAVRLEKAAKDDGRYVDNVALGVATEICAKMYDYEAAVSLVDVHAQRVSSTRKNEAKRFKIDTQNVNILLKLSAWFKAPAIAFRLWAASLPRWGVRLDGVSLGLLLYTARRVELSSGPDGCDADFDTRFQLLMNEFSFRRKDKDEVGDVSGGAYRAYDEDGFAKGDARVLLDPPGFKWYKAYGSFRPWQQARQIFRQVVLDNWPFLNQVTSPLELDSGMLGFASFFGGTLPHSNVPEHSTTLPLPTARYTHIIPAAPTWYAYIRLLGTFNRVEEIPLALAWMKELGMKPSWQTMCEALTFISEVEGPRRRVNGWTEDGGARLVRDEEILRRWLCEWLGYGSEMGTDGMERSVVPAEEDVSDFRRSVMESGKKLIL